MNNKKVRVSEQVALKIKQRQIYLALIGKTVTNLMIGEKLWPESSPETQKQNAFNLINGRTSTIKIAHVKLLCELLDFDANKLFNITKS